MPMTVKLFSEPGIELAPCQCPVCGGADQHETGCVIKDVDHVYRRRPYDAEVDWHETFLKNGITINRNPTAERRRR